MSNEGWKYYNHAAIPTCPPHEEPNIEPIKNGSIWGAFGKKYVFIARWTTNWDCGKETNWWYVIKDCSFDINKLKAKRRYEINKGIKNFIVMRINPIDYSKELLKVQIKAYDGWPAKYRPKVNEDEFINSVKNWSKTLVYGCFDKDSKCLCGYAQLETNKNCLEFKILRTIPEYEKKGINAAIIYHILEEYNSEFGKGLYINDGSRSILHETAFQDYLIKYFGFRKVFCNLKITYRFPLNVIVKILYPLRHYIGNNNSITSKVSAILKMEEFAREK